VLSSFSVFNFQWEVIVESEFPDPFVDLEDEPNLQLNRITNAIIGAAIEVHRHLGPGLPESHYEESLAMELAIRGISFVRQPTVEVQYKECLVGKFRLDFVVADTVIVEVKAVEAIVALHSAQLLTYLRVSGLRLGLLINFNVRSLKDGIRRIAH
jgi:GxxExxY protein